MATKKVIVREPFANLLKRHKADLGLTTADISHICKVPLQTVNQWLQGLRVPNFRSVVALRTKMGIPYEEMAKCKEYHE